MNLSYLYSNICSEFLNFNKSDGFMIKMLWSFLKQNMNLAISFLKEVTFKSFIVSYSILHTII